MNDLRAKIEAILDKPRQYTSFNFTVNGDKWVFHDDDEFVTRNAVVKLLVEIRKDIRAALDDDVSPVPGDAPMKEAPPGPYHYEPTTPLPETKWKPAPADRDALEAVQGYDQENLAMVPRQDGPWLLREDVLDALAAAPQRGGEALPKGCGLPCGYDCNGACFDDDREALVDVIEKNMLIEYGTHGASEHIADALLAAGWRRA